MFSAIMSDTSASLLRLPGRLKWKDRLGRRFEVLTRSQEEDAEEEEEDCEFWQRLRVLDSRGIVSYSTLPLQLRLRGNFDSSEIFS